MTDCYHILAVILTVMPPFKCSTLTSLHHNHPHLPQISVGPYNPWQWNQKLMKDLEEHHPKTLINSKKHFPSRQSYQTNIVIDPHTKSTPVVEIVTSDLLTGHELGRTHWSGPGTLTLSSISEAVVKNINNYNKFKRATPSPFYPSNQSSISDDVELIEVPEEHKEENQHYQPPPPVIGSLCRSQYDCSGALRAVCAPDKICNGYFSQVPCNYTCQCPRHFIKKTNTYKPKKTKPSYYSPLRLKRSLMYYEECVYDL